MSEKPAELRADELVEGRTTFRIRKCLGAGGFGTVYLAEQEVLDVVLRPVALKILSGELVRPDNAAEQLNDAVRLLGLQQEAGYSEIAENLVTMLDVGLLRDREDRAYMAMEYVEGEELPGGGKISTLRGLIRAWSPAPVELAVRWMVQILKPVAWMHSLRYPILHCDLKPDNVLVAGKGVLKVADFGSAQLAVRLLGTDIAAGTITYQAPETLAGKLPTPASDVYSLGLIFYEILTRQNPFSRVGLEALAAKRYDQYRHIHIEARESGVPPLESYSNPDLEREPQVAEIVHRSLRFREIDRYENAGALLRDLERYMCGKAVSVIPERPEREPERNSPTLERLLTDVQLFLRQRRLDDARRRIDEARKLFPKSGKPYSWAARTLLAENKENWKEALRTCAEGLKVDPHEPELFDASAEARELAGQPAVAAEMRKMAAQLRKKGKK